MSQRHIESGRDLESLSDPGDYDTTEINSRQEGKLLNDAWQGVVRGSKRLIRTAFSTPVIRRGLLLGAAGLSIASLSPVSADQPGITVDVPVGEYQTISGVTKEGKLLEATQILRGKNGNKITAVIYPGNYANYPEAIEGAKKFVTYQYQAYPFSNHVEDYDWFVVNPDNIEKQECQQNGLCPREPFYRNVDRFMQATGKVPHENYQLTKSNTHEAGGQGVVAATWRPSTIYNQISVVLPLELIDDNQMMAGPHETGAKYGYRDNVSDQTSVMGNVGVRTFNPAESAFIESILSNPKTRTRRYYLTPENEIVTLGISSNVTPTDYLREKPPLVTSSGMNINLTLNYPIGTTQHYIEMTQPDGPGVTMILNPQDSFELKAPQIGVNNQVSLHGQTQTWKFCSSSADVALAKGDPGWEETIEAWPERFFTNKCRITQIRMPDADPSLITTFQPQPGETVSTANPLLRWINADPTVFYNRVQVSKNSAFNTDPATAEAPVYDMLIHGGESKPLNSWQLPDLEPGTRYYWRVTPVAQGDAKDWGWSKTWDFYIQSTGLKATLQSEVSTDG